ncbi:hypothetical protein HDU92_007865 [Lobulomyces angularis]|nr:hypothetical protein HDU92_007865 [Lobulomyces angularis]
MKLTLLAIFSSGVLSSPTQTLQKNSQNLVRKDVSNEYISIGCYTEGKGGRALNGPYIANNAMTVETCQNFCSTAPNKFQFFGLEYGRECYCGSAVANSASETTKCTKPCSGNASQMCGGPSKLNLYSLSGIIPAPPNVIKDNLPSNWKYIGCFLDQSPKLLNTPIFLPKGTNSVKSCIQACSEKKFTFAGLEYGTECYCGNSLTSEQIKSFQKPDTDCSMTCSGNAQELCGAANRLTLYQLSSTSPQPPALTSQPTEIPTIPATSVVTDPAPTVSNPRPPVTEDPPLDPPVPAPNTFVAIGCYSEGNGGRSLTGSSTASDKMTVETCLAFCAGFKFAGLEYSRECFCGNGVSNGGKKQENGCNMKCAGNSNQICGGPSRLSLYSIGGAEPNLPHVVKDASELISGWNYAGCQVQPANGKLLKNVVLTGKTVTVKICIQKCVDLGYNAAGIEYGEECYCDKTTLSVNQWISYAVADTGCSMTCPGDSSQFCGAGNKLSAWVLGTVFEPSVVPTTISPSTLPPTSIATSVVPTSVPATDTVISTPTPEPPSAYTLVGCYTEIEGRAIRGSSLAQDSMTIQMCHSHCQKGKYLIAGLEYGRECYCGNVLYGTSKLTTPEKCAKPCGGDSTQICGNGGHLSLYTVGGVTPDYYKPPAVPTNLPEGWGYEGCYRDLGNLNPTYKSIFEFTGSSGPYQNNNIKGMTVQKCIENCETFGFPYAGVQYGHQCFCGDAIDATAVKSDESQCNVPCTADPTTLCGGGKLSNVFHTKKQLYQWNTIEHPGHYEYLVTSPDIPIMAGLVPYSDKVIMTGRASGGPLNSTHTYEFDYKTLQFRELHEKTEIFCGAGVVLGDNLGRQLTVGGWSVVSLAGVRVFKPSGLKNELQTSDWQEDADILSLQRPRWYPTVVTLANGHIALVGGSISANNDAEPTIEMLPSLGKPPVFVQLLQDSTKLNLYPSAYILPSGLMHLFVGKRSALYETENWTVVRELPECPNHVSGSGGRSNPDTSGYAMLPLQGPDFKAEWIACGGSLGINQDAFETCARIFPEDPNAKWVVERMPMRRVMPNFVSLPDGTFLLLNGAEDGASGFSSARKPVLQAVIYDPSLPSHKRFSYGGKTTITRMYHSGATLLPDGRVLVHGQDPNADQSPEKDPERNFGPERRFEVYFPPYLDSGKTKPTLKLDGSRDLPLGKSFSVTVGKSYNGNVRFNLIRVDVVTHSVYVDQRFIWLDATPTSDTKYAVNVPANPNVAIPGWYLFHAVENGIPSDAIYVRVGGDPFNIHTFPNAFSANGNNQFFDQTNLGPEVNW